jgi:hypothetical protein
MDEVQAMGEGVSERDVSLVSDVLARRQSKTIRLTFP